MGKCNEFGGLQARRVETRKDGGCTFCTARPELVWEITSASPHRITSVRMCDVCVTNLQLTIHKTVGRMGWYTVKDRDCRPEAHISTASILEVERDFRRADRVWVSQDGKQLRMEIDDGEMLITLHNETWVMLNG